MYSKILTLFLLVSYLISGCNFSPWKLNNRLSGINSNGSGISGYSQKFDSAGSLYFADEGNNLVRKVTATGIISTIVGNGTAGYTGDGGLATAAELKNPSDVAVDASGNIYIADTGNAVIRKVTASTGIISTIVGNGTAGYLGDGGAGTAAELNSPDSVAVDASSNIYIADTNNSAIRKVTVATGVISTIAGDGNSNFTGDGGLATAAELSQATGVAVDGSGNVYIADTGNSVIRKITAATGIISTIAGNSYGYSGDGGLATAAGLVLGGSYGISTIAVDSSGNIYIADTGNSAIRKITASTGIITTIAGTGTAGYSGDSGLATASQLNNPSGIAIDSSGNIYIADTYNSAIRKITVSTGIISTMAGNGTSGYSGNANLATAAELYYPSTVVTDSSGNVYITDTSNSAIRKVIAATGVVSTVAGNGTAGYAGDGGLATSAELHGPAAVAVDSSGNIYIADTGNSVIRKVTASNGIISTIAGNGTAGYSGDGGFATSAKLNSPSGVVLDNSGNIFIADSDNNVIRKVVSTGVISTVAGNGTAGYTGDSGGATAAELNGPSGLAIDIFEVLYIADTINNVIRKINLPAGTITTLAGNGTAGQSGDGGSATAAELYSPTGVAVDSGGNVYVADTQNSEIRKVTFGGVISTIAGNGTAGNTGNGGLATAAELRYPNGVAVDGSGNVFLADTNNSVVRKINASNGLISIFAGNSVRGHYGYGSATNAQLNNPSW